MTRKRLASLVAATTLAVLASSCDKGDKSGTTQTSSVNVPMTSTTNVLTEPKVQPVMAQAAGAPTKPSVAWRNVGFSTPESVLYDEAADVYLVSNIDGEPQDADGKGFISRITPDGVVATLKWIESGKNKVKLDSPKGMAILDDKLWVADIDVVRLFDRKTGAPLGEVKIPGASDLNDVTVVGGRVFVSDTGMKRTGKKVYEPAGTDAVYAIDKNKKVTTIAKSKELGGPNGLAPADDGKVWVATLRTGEVYKLDMKGEKSDVHKLPRAGLDGVVVRDGELIVTTWDGSAVFRGKGSDWKVLISETPSPADIGFDPKRGRLLVPIFNENEIRAYDVK
jgi:hypothetical protein